MPTYETTTGGKSIVGLALVPNKQINLWTNLKIANTHDITQDTHHSIIAESIIPIYHQIEQTETKYTINYNSSDAPRFQAFTARMTNTIQEKIIEIKP